MRMTTSRPVRRNCLKIEERVMDRLVQMMINMVMRRGIDMAMNKGADLIVGRGKSPEPPNA